MSPSASCASSSAMRPSTSSSCPRHSASAASASACSSGWLVRVLANCPLSIDAPTIQPSPYPRQPLTPAQPPQPTCTAAAEASSWSRERSSSTHSSSAAACSAACAAAGFCEMNEVEKWHNQSLVLQGQARSSILPESIDAAAATRAQPSPAQPSCRTSPSRPLEPNRKSARSTGGTCRTEGGRCQEQMQGQQRRGMQCHQRCASVHKLQAPPGRRRR